MDNDLLVKVKAKRLRLLGVKGTRQVIEKNSKYGDAIRKVAEKMRVDYPNGVNLDQYEDMLLWVRTQDKLSRIASYTPERRAADDESPWGDVRGYGLLGEEKDLPFDIDGIDPGAYEV